MRQGIVGKIVCCAIGLCAFTAAGQDVEFGDPSWLYSNLKHHGRFAELLRPEFTKKEGQVIARELELDEPQRYVIRLLIEDYMTSFNEAADTFRETLSRYRGPMMHMMHMARGEGEPVMMEFMGDGGQFIPDFDPAMMGDVEVIMLGDGDELGVFISEGVDGAMMGIHPAIEGALDGEDPGLVAVQMEIAIDMDTDDVTDDGSDNGPVRVQRSAKAGPDGVHVEMSITGPDGKNLLPPEVMKKLHEKLRARLEERLANRLHDLKNIAKESKKQKQEQQETPEATAEEVVEAANTMRTTASALRDVLIEDITLLLTKIQTEDWPGVQRELRRRNDLPRGELSGERLNLHRLLNELESSAADLELFQPILDEIDLNLNAALENRQSLLTKGEIDMFSAFAAEDRDQQRKLMKKNAAARVTVRDVNERGVDTIAEALPDVAAEQFRDLAQRQAYTRVFRPTRTQRMFIKAREFEGIESETLEALQTAQQAYLDELNSANERLVGLMREHEPSEQVRMMDFADAARHGRFEELNPGPVDEAFMERSKIGRRYIERIQSILPKEQFEKIRPKRPSFMRKLEKLQKSGDS